MPAAITSKAVAAPSVLRALAPFVAIVFIAFLVIGLALPVLPLHVHQSLGLSTFAVGMIAGAQFSAALVSRLWAGHLADSRGARRAVVTGLLLAMAGGFFYYISLWFVALPHTSAAILLLGRALLGGAESFVVTGTFSWGLAIAGPRDTGRVMAWVGMSMYFAYAVGAPVGAALYARYGFAAIALATTLVPGVSLLLAASLRPVAPLARARPAYGKVLRAVGVPGIGLACSGVGFGAIATFTPLLFADRDWGPAWPAFVAVSFAFVSGRLFFGHLPDRIGGARVALVCVLIEAFGLALLWQAPSATLAMVGAALSGFGYALAYPGFGIEAVRRAPPENQALAMGAYTGCLDLALGVGSPLLGLIAGKAGLTSVFVASMVLALGAAIIALGLLYVQHSRRSRRICLNCGAAAQD